MALKAKKSLGQNFLVNPHILDRIVSAAEISKNDIILEVGPGTGNLTKKLAGKAGKVIAVEKDRRLIEPLREMFKNSPEIEITEGDILRLEVDKLFGNSGYKVVGNIPYYITSNFLRIIFEKWPRPELIILTIQKEVAQRMMARPPHMNLLALSVQYYAGPEIISYISKNNFRPVPKVDSAVIRLVPKSVIRNPQFFNLIKTGFSGKRKQLLPLLIKNLDRNKDELTELFKKTGINPNTRAENLSLEQWVTLNNSLNTPGD